MPSPAQRLGVAIVGCGSAGPALAAFLARQGHHVTVFERAPECRPVGAGFLLQPTGLSVLAKLGIAEEVRARGARVERLHVVDRDGADLLDLRYREIGHGLYGLGLHRPVLLDCLLTAAESAGAEINWGWEIVSAVLEGNRWTLEDRHGRSAGGFDLLVAADGPRSALREIIGLRGTNRGYPWGAHWFIGENRGAFPEHELHQIVHGTRRLLGFLATGTPHAGGAALVSLFWSLKLTEDPALRAAPLEQWKSEILDLCPGAGVLLDQIDRWDQVITARYGDVRMSSWHSRRSVIIGDAGHAMSPQLGQGVNLALADAECLADAILHLPLQDALAAYSRRRKFALNYYRFASRQLTPWFQSDHRWLAPVRRAAFGTARRIAPARRFMTRTMAGLVGPAP